MIALGNNDRAVGFGGGSFGPRIVLSSSVTPQSAFAIDLTNDGLVDILTAGSQTLAFFKNLGNDQFGSEQVIAFYSSLLVCTVLSFDFNNDTLPDIIVETRQSTSWELYENLGNGLFGSPTTGSLGTDINSVGCFSSFSSGRGIYL